MVYHLRFIKIGMVASIALFFSIVAFDNILDFNSNLLFVQHVLSMDTTDHAPKLMWRSITNPVIHHYAYYLIIAWQILTAMICWIGCVKLLSRIKKSGSEFNEARKMAFIGLFLGFLLYVVGFIVIGGEWFCMWQSKTWNGQTTAGLFIMLIMAMMIYLQHDER